VTINARTLCSANFRSTAEPPPPTDESFAISVQVSNQGGPDLDRVYSEPDGILCRAGGGAESVCTAEFTSAQVQLFAQPADVSNQSEFQGWGGCDEVQGEICVVDNPGDGSTVNIGASFQPPTAPLFWLEFQDVIGPGRVRTNPSAILCPGGLCAVQFPQSTLVEVIVEPDAGAVVQQWSGDCAAWSAETLLFQFFMQGNVTCSVTFAFPP
jgi:hypothetical protein